MQDIDGKLDADATALGRATAAEWNSFATELINLIQDAGIVLAGGDLDQIGKAIADNVGVSSFYTASGVDTIALTPIPDRQGPPAYVNGMKVRFRPGAANTTGAVQLNVNALGNKSLKHMSGRPISIGYLDAFEEFEARYDGTDFLLTNLGAFDLVGDQVTGFFTVWTEVSLGLSELVNVDGVGRCRAYDGFLIEKAAATFQKDVQEDWASGSTNGGVSSALETAAGVGQNIPWFVLSKPDGTIDFGWDSVANAGTGAGLLADATGYTHVRQIGWDRIVSLGATNSGIQAIRSQVHNTNRLDLFMLGEPEVINSPELPSAKRTSYDMKVPPLTNPVQMMELDPTINTMDLLVMPTSTPPAVGARYQVFVAIATGDGPSNQLFDHIQVDSSSELDLVSAAATPQLPVWRSLGYIVDRSTL